MGRRSDIDWEAIERDVRIGHLTLAEVCTKHSIARSSLNKKMKENGWERDLSDTVKAATKAAIQAERAEKAKQLSDSAESIGTEIGREIGKKADSGVISDIKALAAANVIADRRHRSIAEKIVRIADALHEELEQVSRKPMEIQELISALRDTGDDDNKELASEIRKILSLPSRANVLDKLAGAATKAINMEREILGLTDNHGDEDESETVIIVNGVKVDG